MSGVVNEPETIGDTCVLTGKAPVSEMKDYAIEVASYTKGYGMLSCALSGYEPCHDQEKVIEEIGYEPDSDVENTADSVFCEHGAGVNVKWDQADEYMDVQVKYDAAGGRADDRADHICGSVPRGERDERVSKKGVLTEEEELERIFEMTYGKRKEHRIIPKREIESEEKKKTKPAVVREEYLLVDGYNIIFAWDDLKELAKVNMDSARKL